MFDVEFWRTFDGTISGDSDHVVHVEGACRHLLFDMTTPPRIRDSKRFPQRMQRLLRGQSLRTRPLGAPSHPPSLVGLYKLSSSLSSSFSGAFRPPPAGNSGPPSYVRSFHCGKPLGAGLSTLEPAPPSELDGQGVLGRLFSGRGRGSYLRLSSGRPDDPGGDQIGVGRRLGLASAA